MYSYDHPRPAVSADVILVAGRGEHQQVLLIRRGKEPFKGRWAFPGGFMEERETLEACAARELAEETGITGVDLEQFRAMSDPDRDPRGRVITMVFLGVLDEPMPVAAADDAAEARWWPVNDLPPLAFDHDQVIAGALEEGHRS